MELKTKTRKILLYLMGFLMLVWVLFAITGIEFSLIGLGILVLETIKTPKNFIGTMLLTIVFYGIFNFLARRIKDD